MAAISITTLVYGASRDLGIPKMRHLDSEIYRHFLSNIVSVRFAGVVVIFRPLMHRNSKDWSLHLL